MRASERQRIISDWVTKKISETYIRIEDGWNNCEFRYNWLKTKMPLRNSRFAAVILVITCLTAAMAGTPTAPSSASSGSRGDNDDPSGPVRPTVPAADRHTRTRFSPERADSLMANPRVPDAQILVGDVVFRRGDMMMYCDSAIFFSTAASDSMEGIRQHTHGAGRHPVSLR